MAEAMIAPMPAAGVLASDVGAGADGASAGAEAGVDAGSEFKWPSIRCAADRNVRFTVPALKPHMRSAKGPPKRGGGLAVSQGVDNSQHGVQFRLQRRSVLRTVCRKGPQQAQKEQYDTLHSHHWMTGREQRENPLRIATNP